MNQKLGLFLLFSIAFISNSLFSAEKPYLLGIVKDELQYHFEKLKSEKIKPYYIACRVDDDESRFTVFEKGVLYSSSRSFGRRFDVSVRVGTPLLDNTHRIRKGTSTYRNSSRQQGTIPTDNNPVGMKQSLWGSLGESYRKAVKDYNDVLESQKSSTEEEDKSPDFTQLPPTVLIEAPVKSTYDESRWNGVAALISKMFRAESNITRDSVYVAVDLKTKTFVDTDGTEISIPERLYTLTLLASGLSSYGTAVGKSRVMLFKNPEEILDVTRLSNECLALIRDVKNIMAAPAGEPYAGPVIFSGEAAGVLFHEIFGHRIEGHRQKDESSGQTFTRKIGQRIFPEFISITDDPTASTAAGVALSGNYAVDDEGTKASSVSLVKNGVLSNFLMSREGVLGFPPNGHGRGQIGRDPTSRMGNTMVLSTRKTPFPELRKKLIALCVSRNLPYGYFFKEVQGGFTQTSTSAPQVFKVFPIMVYRIRTNGAPDELVSGIDIVGTPLSSITKIVDTSADYKVFNGICGAESGSVPVSAMAPDILFEEFEVERRAVSFDKKPILPAPLWRDTSGDNAAAIVSVMKEEIASNLISLVLEGKAAPYFIGYRRIASETTALASEYGSTVSRSESRQASLYADIRAGSYENSSDDFFGRRPQTSYPITSTSFEESAPLLKKHLWRLSDGAYKNAADNLVLKNEYLAQHPEIATGKSFSRETPQVLRENAASRRFDTSYWEAALNDLSRKSSKYTNFEMMSFSLANTAQDRRYLNSEGTEVFDTPVGLSVSVELRSRRKNGVLSVNRLSFPLNPVSKKFATADLARIDEALRSAHDLIAADDLREDFTAPVLFESRASATLFAQSFFLDLFKGGEPILREGGGEQRSAFSLQIGKDVLPGFLSLYDDAGVTNFEKEPLRGFYKLDFQGIPPRRVLLVDHGKVTNALYARRPDAFSSRSTGHGRSGYGPFIGPVPGNLFIESETSKPASELRASLLALCREKKLASAIVVRELQPNGKFFGIKEGVLLDVATGKEKPFSGGLINNFDLKKFKDILAVSKERTAVSFNPSALLDSGYSIVAPEILVDGLEVAYKKDAAAPAPLTLPPNRR